MNTTKLSRKQKNVLSWVYLHQFVDTEDYSDTLGVQLPLAKADTPQAHNVRRATISRIFRKLEERELLARTLHRGRLYVKLTDAGVNVALPFYRRDVERGRWKQPEPEPPTPPAVNSDTQRGGYYHVRQG